MTLGLMFGIAALWVTIVMPEGAGVLGVLLIAFAGAVQLWHERTPPAAGGLTWRAATSKLLAEQPWRETPAKVLNTRGTVLVFPGGEYVRVTGLPAAPPTGDVIADMWLRFFVERFRAEAVDVSWRVRRNGLADGTATLVLPDGRGFTEQLDRAPLDLFANVVREKALWVAGNRVVGFPCYPVVATARLGNGT
jgi:hypothetical protein